MNLIDLLPFMLLIVLMSSVQRADTMMNGTRPSARPSDEYHETMRPAPRILSRRRRYIAFPEGSSFSVAFCATFGMIGNPDVDYLSWAMNWGIAYDLPNNSWVAEQRHKKVLPKPIVQRRHRRDLYNRIEVAIDNMGYNGRECIQRALCESAQYFHQRTTNMIEELIRTIFRMPSTRVLSFEGDEMRDYDDAYRVGQNNVHCRTAYPKCTISLIELALGTVLKPMNFM